MGRQMAYIASSQALFNAGKMSLESSGIVVEQPLFYLGNGHGKYLSKMRMDDKRLRFDAEMIVFMVMKNDPAVITQLQGVLRKAA